MITALFLIVTATFLITGSICLVFGIAPKTKQSTTQRKPSPKRNLN